MGGPAPGGAPRRARPRTSSAAGLPTRLALATRRTASAAAAAAAAPAAPPKLGRPLAARAMRCPSLPEEARPSSAAARRDAPGRWNLGSTWPPVNPRSDA